MAIKLNTLNTETTRKNDSQDPFGVIPFHIMDGFILIDGEVNGIRGHFILDTATPFNFLLNNNYLPLSKNDYFASGHATSGQPIVIFSQSRLSNIRLLDCIIGNDMDGIKHANLDFVQQGVSESFLGFLGHDFFKESIFCIDYQAQCVYLHQYDDQRMISSRESLVEIDLCGDMVLPEIELTIGQHKLTGFFDTGNQGSLELTLELMTLLEQAGDLVVHKAGNFYGELGDFLIADLKNIKYQNVSLKDTYGLSFTIGDTNRFGMGYQFLKNYKSSWLLNHKKMYLMA